MNNVRSAYRTTNRKLLISCASLAVAAALLHPAPAAAQFNGSATGSTGVNAGTLGTNQISVTSSGATINWNATTNDFLPSTATQTFTSSLSDYTVLNRITPADAQSAVQINGTLTSYVSGVTSGASNGGKIWFYSPSGLLIGSSAKIDVGGLLLSSIAPTLNSNDAGTFSASFSPLTGDGGAITIDAGAQIKALQQNSYVAVIAPSITQGGTVKVDGSVAYVAAETVSEMKFDQGLFDITVPADGGSSSFIGINHYGTTTGGDTAAQSGTHRIYIAAVPKNEAITMLLGGTIGFDASVAGYEDGQIRLSSGWTSTFDPDSRVENYHTFDTNTDAGIQLGAGNYLSDIDAIANGTIEAYTGGGDIRFGGDIFLWSLNGDVDFRAVEGNIDVFGDATMFSSGDADQEVLVYAGAGDITFHQAANLGGGADWGDPEGTTASADASTAGVTVETSGGTITAQTMQLNTFAGGQDNAGGGDEIGGDGFAGDIKLWAYGGGKIKVTGDLGANANANGGDMRNGSIGGGRGEAGNIYVWATGGTIDVDGYVYLSAVGTGGSYIGTASPVVAQGGDGIGGDIDAFSSDGGRIEFGDADKSVSLNAFGNGGSGQSGGAGYGGNAGFSGTGGFIVLPGAIDVNAWGTGGDANVGFGGDGGYAQGGTAYIEARAELSTNETSATFATITGGNANLNASATGGDGGAGYNDGIEVFIAPGSGGDAQAGLYTGFEGSGGAYAAAANAQGDTSSVLGGNEQGGQLTLGNVNLYAGGRGGAGGNGASGQSGGAGGNAYGGSAQAGNYDPDENGLRTASAAYASLNMDATAVGGDGGAGGAGSGDGGAAIAGGYVPCNDGDTCGGVTLNAKGSVVAASINMSAFAQGGGGGSGGDAQGGIGTIQTFGPDSSILVNGDVNLHAGALGGDGDVNGGVATGGLIQAILDGGDITAHGNFSLIADAEGGDGLFGTGGAANGGDVSLDVDGGAGLTVDGALELAVWANHTEETGTLIFGGASSGEAGSAEGGDVTMTIADGAVSAASLGLRATAWGGGGLDDRAGGTAQGGNVTLNIGSAGSLDVAGASELRAVGQGGFGADNSDGAGGAGGSGHGGTVIVTVDGDYSSGTIEQAVRGVGGEGGNGTSALGGDGGYGEGGTNTLIVGSTGSIEAIYTAVATAGGGAGGTGSVRGNGGDAIGGTNDVTINGSVTAAGTVEPSFNGFVVTAFSGGGEGNIGGDATGGSNSITVNGSLTVDGLVQSTARSQGGAGDAQGGNATGGVASLTVNGTLDSGAALVATTATGGAGPTAGSGSGGDSTFFINSETGSATVAQWVDVLSDGYDGTGAYGTGGDASISGPLNAQTVEMAGASVVYSPNVTADNWNLLYYGDANIADFTIDGFLIVEATGALTTNNVTAQSATFVAGNTANFLGTVEATDIAVTSRDINIAAGASLGVQGVTDTIDFDAVSNGQPAIIGDVAQVNEGQYQLWEDGDIYANTVTFTAVPAQEGAPDVIVGDLNIEGDHVSHVFLNSDGSIFVEGIIDFSDAGADDSLALTAANSIQVNTDTGGISITDSSQAYVGTLELTAHDIWVADGSVLGQLNVDPNPANLAALLATNNGPDNQGGYLRAGGIEATMLGSSFLVQNSGTADSFAGLSVGDGGLTITNNGEGPANTIVYGRQVLSDGTIVSGDDFAEAVVTSGSFTTQSTINGCAIGTCGSTPPPPPPPCTTGCEPPPPPPPVEPPPVTPPPPPVTPPPVTPPPVTPPPVTPPPVTPPPVTPPPVTPPPVTLPPELGGAENYLGPIGEMGSPLDLASNDPAESDQDSDDDSDDSGDDQSSVDATLGLVNTGPVNIGQPVDEPITSGGDGGFGGDGPGGL